MNQFPRWAWAPFGIGVLLLVSPLLGMLARVSWAQLPGLRGDGGNSGLVFDDDI